MEGTYSNERIDPGFTPRALVEQHLAAYRFFMPYVTDKDVLEVGFGEGYGSAQLAGPARSVVAIDYNEQAVAHATAKYRQQNNLSFRLMDANALTFPTGSFDVAISSQVIEHLKDQAAFLRALKAVTRPGGTVIVVTPNRYTSMFNPHHVHEYTAAEIRKDLEAVFSTFELLGVFGSERAMAALEERRRSAKRLVSMDVLRLRERLPRSWVVAAYGLAARLLYKKSNRAEAGLQNEVDQTDYWLGNERLDECLDLFAVCHVKPS